MDTFRCPGCHKMLEMQGNEVVISNVAILNNNNDWILEKKGAI